MTPSGPALRPAAVLVTALLTAALVLPTAAPAAGDAVLRPSTAPPAAADADVSIAHPHPRHRWPTGTRVAVVRAFDPPEQRWSAGHRGVDLRSVEGAAVHSSAGGVVAFVGSVAGRPVVSVDHPDGVRTSYEPVIGEVSVGRRVRAGQRIGTLVADVRPAVGGTAPALHPPGVLHWGARVREGTSAWRYLDPLTLVDVPVVRLLPVGFRPGGGPA